MHVMIATDGTLDPAKTTRIATRLVGAEGKITVFTAVIVPRGLLDDMRAAAGEGAAEKAYDKISIENRTTQAGNRAPVHWLGDDAVMDRFVKNHIAQATADLAGALTEAGAKFEIVGVEGEDVAKQVLKHANENSVDVLLIGTHGMGRFDGLLGASSTKLARRAACSVVLVR